MASPTQEPAPRKGPVGREDVLIERIGSLLARAPFAVPNGQIWFGDDAAILKGGGASGDLVVCTDAAVEGVHCDLGLVEPADLGWKAVMATASDVAAMGGSPTSILVTVVGPLDDVELAMEGAANAAIELGVPIVGGDTSASATLVASATVLGKVPHGQAVLRSGAKSGDYVMVTGPLGASAAGLRCLRAAGTDVACIERHRRPRARIAEGIQARSAGASAMIDVSDGLSIDLHRLADASVVGFSIEVVPVADGATHSEALSGGEDYELVFTTADADAAVRAFCAADLEPPCIIGRIVDDPAIRTVLGELDVASGWLHH